jgi:hypothetical protein
MPANRDTQRTRRLLQLKGFPFELTELDISNSQSMTDSALVSWLWRDTLLEHPATMSSGLTDKDRIKLYENSPRGVGSEGLQPSRERSSYGLSVPLASLPLPSLMPARPSD